MSVVVDELPPVQYRGFTRKYPWERWTDGQVHWLKRGEDFELPVRKFVKRAHRHAEMKGFCLRTRTRGDDVWLVFGCYSRRGAS